MGFSSHKASTAHLLPNATKQYRWYEDVVYTPEFSTDLKQLLKLMKYFRVLVESLEI